MNFEDFMMFSLLDCGELANLLHECMFRFSRNQQLCRASYVTSYITFVPSLLVVKRVASTFVEVSVFLGFCVC